MFPKRNVKLIVNDEEVKIQLVDKIVDEFAASMIEKLVRKGFDVQDTGFDKHFSFTMESLRSAIFLTMGIDHPLQELVDKAVSMLENSMAANDDDEYDPA